MRPNTEIPRLAPVRRRHGFFSPPRSGRTRAGGWSLRTLARAAEHTGCSMPSSPRCTSSQSGALLEDPPPQPLHPVFKYNAQIICKVLGGGGREGDRGGRVGRSCASRGPRAGETPPPPPSLWLSFFWLAICFHLGEFAGSEPPASAQTPLSSKPPVHCASISRSAHVLGASLMRADTG